MIYQLFDDYFVRALQESDLEGPYRSWFEDQEVCRYNSHGKFFKTAAYFRAYYDNLNSESQVLWAICHKTDGHIGNISLNDISFIDRRAEFRILLGDKRHWGKGVGLAAGKRLIQHGLFKLNLERIYCGVAENNMGMKKLALGLGMVQEGSYRNHAYLEGKWVNVVLYGLLKHEWQSEKPNG